MHVLATFLGGGPNRSYRTARYRFKKGVSYKTPLFGWALLQHLQSVGNPADKLVVFGTPTSFWEHLLEVTWPGHEDVNRVAAMAGRGISAKELNPFAELVFEKAKIFGVREVRLELIDFLETSSAQMRVINRIADLVHREDKISLDITHGFRHQPVLSTLAAMVLRSTGHAEEISGIYYGALEMSSEGSAPVLRLDPLLGYADWIEALAKAEVSGDYGSIADRLRKEQVSWETCDALAEGSFQHAIGNYDSAVKQFDRWKAGIGRVIRGGNLGGPAALFVNEINARIDLLTASNRLLRLIEDAGKARERGALVRAAELGWEAASTILAEKGLDVGGYYERYGRWKNGRPHFHIQDAPQARWKIAFARLNGMRNAMAHLDFEKQRHRSVVEALASRAAAAAALKEDFHALFSVDPNEALDFS